MPIRAVGDKSLLHAGPFSPRAERPLVSYCDCATVSRRGGRFSACSRHLYVDEGVYPEGTPLTAPVPAILLTISRLGKGAFAMPDVPDNRFIDLCSKIGTETNPVKLALLTEELITLVRDEKDAIRAKMGERLRKSMVAQKPPRLVRRKGISAMWAGLVQRAKHSD